MAPQEMFPCLEFKWDSDYQDGIKQFLGQQKLPLWGTIRMYKGRPAILSTLWAGQQFQSTWEPVYEASMKGYVGDSFPRSVCWH